MRTGTDAGTDSAGVMGEGLIGVGHAMRLLAKCHGLALTAGRRIQLIRQALGDRSTLFRTSRVDQPSERQRLLPLAIHLDRHLVVGAADALGPDLDVRLDILDRLAEELPLGLGLALGTLLFFQPYADDFHRGVNISLGAGFLPLLHTAVDETRQHLVAIPRIGAKLLLRLGDSSGHRELLAHLPQSRLCSPGGPPMDPHDYLPRQR